MRHTGLQTRYKTVMEYVSCSGFRLFLLYIMSHKVWQLVMNSDEVFSEIKLLHTNCTSHSSGTSNPLNPLPSSYPCFWSESYWTLVSITLVHSMMFRFRMLRAGLILSWSDCLVIWTLWFCVLLKDRQDQCHCPAAPYHLVGHCS